jgi:hypothetical protein
METVLKHGFEGFYPLDHSGVVAYGTPFGGYKLTILK